MNRPILVAAATVLILWACGDQKEPASQEQATAPDTDSTAKVESPYFPVYDFLRNEVEYVDSLPVGIMKFTTVGGKKDSGFIRLEEFHTLAAEFLAPELYNETFKKLFKESSFFDAANNNATFFYKTDDESSPVKRVDVITRKGDVYDEVKNVYIEKHFESGDTAFVRKMHWKPKRNFQILTITSSGGKSKDEQIKVVWDNRE
ncbi:MAG: hypothetical protein JNK79_13260 [Chitinophagaceae bacterium]|nr:hypothetical protein [Chitinophagaceae bacterium]